MKTIFIRSIQKQLDCSLSIFMRDRIQNLVLISLITSMFIFRKSQKTACFLNDEIQQRK